MSVTDAPRRTATDSGSGGHHATGRTAAGRRGTTRGPLVPRVARTVVRRGAAPVVAAVFVVIGVGLVSLPVPGGHLLTGWSSTWSNAVSYLANQVVFYGPMSAVVGAWAGGTEHRRGVREVLAATSRPAWQRTTWAWVAALAGVLAGLAVVALAVAAAVLPGVSYAGGGWLPGLVLLTVTLAAWVSVGFAIGRAWPGRLVALAVGAVGYLLTVWVLPDVPGWLGDALGAAYPVTVLDVPDGYRLRPGAVALAVAFALVAATAAMASALARRRAWALVPGAVALALLVVGPRVGPVSSEDPAAIAAVCTTDDGPQVCVQRVHAGLLPAVTPLAREAMASTQDLVGWRGAREAVVGRPPVADVLELPYLSGRNRMFRSGLEDPARMRADVAQAVVWGGCSSLDPSPPLLLDDAVARALLGGGTAGLADVPGAVERYGRLAGDLDAARPWVRRFREASSTCDVAALERLAR